MILNNSKGSFVPYFLVAWKVASVIANLALNCGAHIWLTMALRENPNLPGRLIAALFLLVGYAHIVWVFRPRVIAAVISFAAYAVATFVMNLLIGTAVIITLYGQ